VLLLLTAGSAAGAGPNAEYPTRTIRIVSPSTPGGASDLVGRVIAQGLTERWPRPAIVENRPGASTMLGGEIVAKSAPDGHTLLVAISTLAIHPAIFKNIPYDALKDFAPVTQAVSVANVFIVHPSLPVKTAKQLIALAKQRPNEILFSSPGRGTSAHLTVELFASMTGTRFRHVPYKSQAPALTATAGGEVSLMSPSITTALPLLGNNKVKAIGVTSEQRAQVAPDIPTIAEQGLPGFQSGNWFGLLAPSGTPAHIVEKLHGESVAILRSPAAAQRFATAGAVIVASTPDEFAAFIRSEMQKWDKVAKTAGIQPE
jgi:tripartite-type tricarboxylate transporter receptor subunit TctC